MRNERLGPTGVGNGAGGDDAIPALSCQWPSEFLETAMGQVGMAVIMEKPRVLQSKRSVPA